MGKNQETSLRYCKGIGEKRENLLLKLDIRTWKDLLYHFPRSYQDWRVLAHPPELLASEKTAFAGTITTVQSREAKYRRLSIIRIVIQRGHLFLPVVFFNQPYLKKMLIPGKVMVVYGKIDTGSRGLEMKQVENWELLASMEEITEKAVIQPVYPLTSGLTQNVMRLIIRNAFENYSSFLGEYLPENLRVKTGTQHLKQTLQMLHFPADEEEIQKGHYSMKVREAVFPLLYWDMKKMNTLHKPYTIHYGEDLEPIRTFIRSLPFSLTKAQNRVLQEIKEDLFAPQPMRRLLQGDVGSGKTIVAFISALFALYSGHQACFMVPTEILALQHYDNLQKIIAQQKLETKIYPVALLGSLSAGDKNKIQGNISKNKYNFIIGTHALFQEKVNIPRLAYAIIDEQHRFGVAQRGQLVEKGDNPDVLIMTATPIPRTLTMTLYGDLDVSVIDELPPGRQKVHTRIIDRKSTDKLISFCRQYLKNGGQIYVICPLIEESEKLDLKAASQALSEYNRFFNPYKCALLHGKMNSTDKKKVMEAFTLNKVQVLVSTTVIEVGVDVANANLMIIEHPERFGLSQLHQLRGRIGRSRDKGYCFLKIPPKLAAESFERLRILEKTSDGFDISHHDLQFRGPGEFTGTRQHGFLDFQFLDLALNLPLISTVRGIIGEILADDPQLQKEENQPLKEEFLRKYHDELRYLDIK